MARFLKKREQVKGQSPGALIFVGTQKMDAVNIRLIDYDAHHLTEKKSEISRIWTIRKPRDP